MVVINSVYLILAICYLLSSSNLSGGNMKFVASVLSAGLLVATLHANALVQTIECRNPNAGEGGQSFKLTMLKPAMPGISGTALATATEGWLGGTRNSGGVTVEVIMAADGGPMTL